MRAFTLSVALAAAIAASPSAQAQSAEAQRAVAGKVRSTFKTVVLREGPSRGRTYVPPELLPGPRRAATFIVTFGPGFPNAAKTAFNRAVNLWAALLSSPVPITVNVTWEPLSAGVLGVAGGPLSANFPNAPRPDTWYAHPIANKRAGVQLSPTPDIVGKFNSTFPSFHFGATAAPLGKIDFTSVAMHELGHGLGFAGFGQVSGGLGTVRGGGLLGAYDHLTETRTGTPLKNLPDPSLALGTQLQSTNVFFDSPRVRAANNNKRAELFAPPIFQPGSSYSHLDEALYAAGNKNSLMTPAIGPAETIRSPGPITRAIFKDIGW